MRTTAKLVIFGIFLLAAGQAFGQLDTLPTSFYNGKFLRYNFNFNGGGARAAAMGHAFTGISDDMNALSWNPAGLLAIDKVAMSLSYRNELPRGTSTATPFTATSVYVSQFPGSNMTSDPDEFKHNGTFGGISTASIVIPMRMKGHPFVGSLSYVSNYDEYQVGESKFSTDLPVIINIPGTIFTIPFVSPTDFQYKSELHGSLNTVAFGFGTRLYGNLSGGVSVNVYSGHMYRTEEFRQFSHNYPTLFNNSTQFVELDGRVLSLDSNKFSSFNFSLGFKYAQPQWTAGLVVRTPYSLDVTLDSIQYRSALINGQSSGDAADTIIAPRELTRYRMPLIIRAGLGYKATQDLLLALDFEYQGFSGKKILYRTQLQINPGADNIESFNEIDGNWQSVFAVRTGAEYVKQTKLGEIPLRAGFEFVPLPAPSVDIDGSTSSEKSIGFGLGTGIHWSQVLLDIAYNYTSYNTKSNEIFPGYVGQAFLSSGYPGFIGVPVESNYHNHQVTVSFTGYF